MAETRSAPKSTGRQIAASAFWVVAVAAILVLAAVLRSDPPEMDDPASSALPQPGVERSPVVDPPPALPAQEAPAPARVEAIVEPEPPPALSAPLEADEPPRDPKDRLADRARNDAARLGRSREAWTAQIAVLCDPNGAQAFVARVGADPRLHVLPAEVDGRSCFRICWGAYSGRDEAALAPGLPRALLGGQRPAPRRVAEVVP